jgi:hypothetical protein
MSDLRQFLNDQMMAFATGIAFDLDGEAELFRRTFTLIDDSLGQEAFRRWDSAKERFMGPFSVSAFEAMSVGVANSVDDWEALESQTAAQLMGERIVALWQDPAFRKAGGSGVRASSRIPVVIPLGKGLFAP